MLERKWWTLAVVCVAIFMLLLDITIVNVALPGIESDLSASFTELQWVVDAYALTLATCVLAAGSLADLLGRKRVFVGGVVVFTVASLLCAVATGPAFLILARGLQGVGGAIMFATSLALLSQEFDGRERGTAFGIWGATTGAAVAIGPLVGGGLVTGLGWRWIFIVNLPIGALAVVAALLRIGESRDPGHGGLDLPGFATLSAGLFALVFGLLRGNDEGWGSAPIVGLLAGSAALLAAFAWIERRRERPMLDLALFARPTFVGAQATAFALSASIFALFLYLTLYLQNVLGYSALQTGLRFLPITLLSFLVAPAAGKLSVHVPPRLLLAGGLALVGLSLLLMRGVETGSRWTTLLPGFLVGGAGIGLVNAPLSSVAIGVAPRERAGMASGANSTFRQVGIATGIAGLGAIFQHRVQSSVAHGLALAGAAPAEAARSARLVASGRTADVVAAAPPAARAQIAEVARGAFVGGLNTIFLVGALTAFAGALLAFALVRRSELAEGPSR